MYKQIGAVLLVAGTCIGSGMVALPLVLAQLGLIPSIILMLVIWFIMYYSSLINLELNLQAGKGLSLGALGKHFSSKVTELTGTVCLKVLSYALLAVFIYGGSSILQELMASRGEVSYSLGQIATGYALVTMVLLWLPIRWIDYCNRFLFIGLMIIVAALLSGLAITVSWSGLPLFSKYSWNLFSWKTVVPVVFTSFGFQVIFHSLSNYCQMDVKMLKRAFFWGSFIPAVVYILWTSSILGAVSGDNPDFYRQMVEGKADIGKLIQVLGETAKEQAIERLVWWISSLAIATSVLGVSMGLCDSLKGMISHYKTGLRGRTFVASLVTILPAYLIVLYVPNAFISVLGFAGMILAIIAILLPVYLLWKIKAQVFYYPALRRRALIHLSVSVAGAVIACEALSFAL